MPGVLLTQGEYYGTLAAARAWGRRGLQVTLADSDPARGTFTGRSRHVTTRVRAPRRTDFDQWPTWLEAYSQTHEGDLLYPCSDDMAWLLARHRDRLSRRFSMLQPSFDTLRGLLDKSRLLALCRQLGIPTPHTLLPRSESELADAVRTVDGLYLVKPRTQVGLRMNRKAEIARSGPDLQAVYRRFQQQFGYVDSVLAEDPDLRWPMLQRFDARASQHTRSVAGFRSRDGRRFHVLSSRKVLQYPLRIGVGLCFESLEVQPQLARWVESICEASGYFGVFEAEFIDSEQGMLLIDFNPRFYGQMQLEITRGLPLPDLVAADAAGQTLPPVGQIQPGRLCNRGLLRLLVTTQYLAGRMSGKQRQRWLNFAASDHGRLADHIEDADDPGPLQVERWQRWRGYLRHPRSSCRVLFGNE